MADPITLKALQDASIDSDTLGEFANEDKIVTSRLGAEYPSAPMASRMLVENGLLGATPFSTYSAMTASALVDGDYAVVTNDVDITKNGIYEKQEGEYIYLKYNPVSSSLLNVEGASIVITDSENNQTWLQASSDDGGLTAVAEQAIRDKIGLEVIDNSPLSYAVTDSLGNLTDIQLDANGHIPQYVLDRWGARLNIKSSDEDKDFKVFEYNYPKAKGSKTTIQASDKYMRDGELHPVLPDKNKMIMIASSSGFGIAADLLTSAKIHNPNLEMYVPAIGGGVMGHQQTLVGDTPVLLKFAGNTIKKSGANIVTADERRLHDRMGDIRGWVQGIKGTLVATNVDKLITFTPDVTTGSDIWVSPEGVEFIPEKGLEYRNAIQILWIGKNNLTTANPALNNPEKLLRDTNRMIEYSSSMAKRFVVITHFANNNAGSDSKERINNVNDMYKKQYGDSVFDANAIILSAEIFTDLGIKRTAQDIADQEDGRLPMSLALNQSHTSVVVNKYLAQKLTDFIVDKNFFGE